MSGGIPPFSMCPRSLHRDNITLSSWYTLRHSLPVSLPLFFLFLSSISLSLHFLMWLLFQSCRKPQLAATDI